jgi:hypothetical protein
MGELTPLDGEWNPNERSNLAPSWIIKLCIATSWNHLLLRLAPFFNPSLENTQAQKRENRSRENPEAVCKKTK